ncbi:hypothetical protein EIP91_010524, partial [Steccherinum ochraceum]
MVPTLKTISPKLVSFKLDGKKYRLHSALLSWRSGFFDTMLSLPQQPDGPGEAEGSESNPITITGATVAEFDSLLHYIYGRHRNNGVQFTIEQLIAILHLSNLWDIPSGRKDAISMLESHSSLTFPRVLRLSQEEDVPQWFTNAFLASAGASLDDSIMNDMGYTLTSPPWYYTVHNIASVHVLADLGPYWTSCLLDLASQRQQHRFSIDSEYFAVGSDDGHTRIYKTTGDTVILKLRGLSPVTAIFWHPPESSHQYKIFVGYGDGSVIAFFADLALAEQTEGCSASIDEGLRIPFPEVQGAVGSFDLNPANSMLAVVIGAKVFVSVSLENSEYLLSNGRAIPDPPRMLKSESSEICPRDVQFVLEADELVVSYLEHGLVGWDSKGKSLRWHIKVKTRIAHSTISQDGKFAVVYNLHSGFDRYDLNTGELISSYSSQVNELQNIVLPVLFIHEDRDLLLGDSRGN